MSKSLRYLPDGQDFSAGDFPTDFSAHMAKPIGASNAGPMPPRQSGHIMARGGALRMQAMNEQTTSDDAQDRAMVKSGVHQHEMHDHPGEPPTPLKLRKGGGVKGRHPRLPRAMKPKMATAHSPVGSAMPVNRPPKNPMRSMTEPNIMPGGQMGYGVQPGDEPAMAPNSGVQTLKKGGRAGRM